MSIIKYLKEEFLTANKFKSANNDYIEVYKNPNNREIRDIMKFNNDYKTIRLGVDENNDIYAWNYKVLHDEMSKYLKTKFILTLMYENNTDFLTAESDNGDNIADNMNDIISTKLKQAIPQLKHINVINDVEFDDNLYGDYDDDDDIPSSNNDDPYQSVWDFK